MNLNKIMNDFVEEYLEKEPNASKEEIAESYERVAEEVYLSSAIFIKMCSIETK